MARTIEYDRERVLQAAIDAFKDAGYAATSMPTLVKATKLQPGSLYAAFSSKEGLLKSSLALYAQRSHEKIQQTLNSADSPLQGVKAVLQGIVEETIQDNKGCFLVNTLLELSPSNTEIQSLINEYLKDIERLIENALRSAQTQGELATDRDCTSLAKFIMVNIWGNKVMAKTGADVKSIQGALQHLLTCLK